MTQSAEPPLAAAPPTPTSAPVLAVHLSQLTRENIALLAQQGYGVPPDVERWVVLVRQTPAPAQEHDGEGADDAAHQ